MAIKIFVKETDLFDDANSRFIHIKPTVLNMEHSLIAISKWESRYHLPFLIEEEKTAEQLEYYFECMTINQNVDPNVYKAISYEDQERILRYIKDPMTATTISDGDNLRKGIGPRGEIITSELIYCWMVLAQVPSEYETWHLNRLLTLIQVINVYNQPPKKVSLSDVIRNNDALNAKRRAKMHSRG